MEVGLVLLGVSSTEGSRLAVVSAISVILKMMHDAEKRSESMQNIFDAWSSVYLSRHDVQATDFLL